MERRSFLKWAINGLGALVGVVLGIPAIAYLIDPRHRAAAVVDFKTVTRLSDLDIGVPKQAVIRDVRRDAWTLHPNDVIGRVWLIRRDKDTVEAFTTICPHLGCSINFETSAKRFVCPCHNGTFHLSGEKVGEQEMSGTNPAPRGMDKLEVQIQKEGEDTVVAVKYQNFRQGLEEKTVIT